MASDGNLSGHLAVLGEVRNVTSRSTYLGKRRTRWYPAIPLGGQEAFETHLHALQLVVDSARQAADDASPAPP